MAEVVSPTLQSQADVWYLKTIRFKGEDVKIITQNFNGPCSFIAICNILILRKNIVIEPASRTTVSYEFLSQLVAEYLLLNSPDVDISAALSIMPHTQKGLDLNPRFTSSSSFQPATETAGGELKLFSQAGIKLVHGWLVDPDSLEAKAMQEEKTGDYDSAVALIAEADHIAGGILLLGESMPTEEGGRKRQEQWTPEERRKVENALTIRHFLEQTQSQLTYHGLFHLVSTIPPGTLVALFRSSHLSVLYKSEASDELPPGSPDHQQAEAKALGEGHPSAARPSPGPNDVPIASLNINDPPTETSSAQPEDGPSSSNLREPTPAPRQPSPSHNSSLYMLATDQVFFNEPTVVWERIEDVDGSAGVFVDSTFQRANPIGGDFAGHTAEEAARILQEEEARLRSQEMGADDHELARQLQAEEYNAYERRSQQMQAMQAAREQDERRQKELHARRGVAEGKSKKKKDCIIM